MLSKKTGKPVKVVWSREDDIKFDSFHSVAAMYFKASLGPDGKPTAWLQRSVFPPIASTFDASAQYADAGEIGLGFSDIPFALPNQRAENGPAPAHTRIGWLRSVANIYHAYGVHSFVGELANAAGKDPVEYVLALLGPDRIMPKSELAEGLHQLRWRLRKISHRHRAIPSGSPDCRGKIRLGQTKTRQRVWNGHRHAPQLPDLCRHRRTSRSKRLAKCTFAASIPPSTRAPS